jgi:hypothetical protein
MRTIAKLRVNDRAATRTALGLPLPRCLYLGLTLLTEHAPAALTFEKPRSLLDRYERDEKEADIVVDPLEPG